MNQYYVIEIQQYANGEYGHIVHYAYDTDPTKARLKGEAKYHEVLASAAISTLPSHAATLLAADGRLIMTQCYKHVVEPEPEPEPEPTPDPEPENPEE